MNTRFGWLARGMILALFLLSFGLVNAAAQTPDDVDGSGNLLPGACFVAFVDVGGGTPGEYVSGTCDFQDGILTIPGLGPGNYVIRETLAPPGYLFGGEWLVTISSQGSQTTVLTIENEPGGAAVTVHPVDENGDALAGACFAIYLDNGAGQIVIGSFFTQGCGNVTFTGFPPGDYILFVGEAPSGYTIPDNVLFSVDGTEGQIVTVRLGQQSLVEQLVAVLIEILRDILGR